MQYLMFLEFNFCCSKLVSILRNTLIMKGTYLANVIGWHLCDYSELQVAGSLIVCYTFWYHIAVYFE